jgi:hypothetical protein
MLCRFLFESVIRVSGDSASDDHALSESAIHVSGGSASDDHALMTARRFAPPGIAAL